MNIQIPGIDTQKVTDLYDDDIDLYKAVLGTCAENLPEVLDKLKEPASDDYAVNIHSIKGTCGTIGAQDLRNEALELEAMAKTGDIKGLRGRNESFLKRAGDLVANINKWLENNQ